MKKLLTSRLLKTTIYFLLLRVNGTPKGKPMVNDRNDASVFEETYGVRVL